MLTKGSQIITLGSLTDDHSVIFYDDLPLPPVCYSIWDTVYNCSTNILPTEILPYLCDMTVEIIFRILHDQLTTSHFYIGAEWCHEPEMESQKWISDFIKAFFALFLIFTKWDFS